MLSTWGAGATRDTMSAQGFELPKLFKEKQAAVVFLNENKLWHTHPGLWVSTMVDPKLKV